MATRNKKAFIVYSIHQRLWRQCAFDVTTKTSPINKGVGETTMGKVRINFLRKLEDVIERRLVNFLNSAEIFALSEKVDFPLTNTSSTPCRERYIIRNM